MIGEGNNYSFRINVLPNFVSENLHHLKRKQIRNLPIIQKSS